MLGSSLHTGGQAGPAWETSNGLGLLVYLWSHRWIALHRPGCLEGKRQRSSLWLQVLPAVGRRSKGNWTDQKALGSLSEAPRIDNPARSRPLNLTTSSAEGTLGVRGTNPAFYSFFLQAPPERKGLQLLNFPIPHKLSECNFISMS